MPWDNNNSGGGNDNSGGPWGQRPSGGPRRPSGGGGGNTPNLEDLLNKGRDSFQGGLPGGKWLFIGGFAALALIWVSQSVYTVDAQEVGVELLFGKAKEELSGPGLHFHMWPIERVEKVSIAQRETILSSITSGRARNDDGLMLTGDQNIVEVSFKVFWSVSAPYDYLFNVSEPDVVVQRAADSAMREVVGRRLASDILRNDYAGIETEVSAITQEILDNYGAGVNIASISIQDGAPPVEVADAFNEVQRAEQDRVRFEEEAKQYSNTKLGEARGRAAQVREEAAAYKNRVVQEAEGEAARFVSIYDEYANAPEVTRRRLFLETMESVLGDSEKVIIENGAQGSGVVPYLPLPALRSSEQGGQ